LNFDYKSRDRRPLAVRSRRPSRLICMSAELENGTRRIPCGVQSAVWSAVGLAIARVPPFLFFQISIFEQVNAYHLTRPKRVDRCVLLINVPGYVSFGTFARSIRPGSDVCILRLKLSTRRPTKKKGRRHRLMSSLSGPLETWQTVSTGTSAAELKGSGPTGPADRFAKEAPL
jgi:hypothetical protein